MMSHNLLRHQYSLLTQEEGIKGRWCLWCHGGDGIIPCKSCCSLARLTMGLVVACTMILPPQWIES